MLARTRTTLHHIDTQQNPQVLPCCPPRPSYGASSRLLGTRKRRCIKKRDHRELVPATSNAGTQRDRSAGREGRSPGQPGDAVRPQPPRALATPPRGLATPSLRRARGGAGRGVYKTRGGRRSFVSCCSDASGSTWSASSERESTVRHGAGLGAYPWVGSGQLVTGGRVPPGLQQATRRFGTFWG